MATKKTEPPPERLTQQQIAVILRDEVNSLMHAEVIKLGSDQHFEVRYMPTG
jgi:hypothetical protein